MKQRGKGTHKPVNRCPSCRNLVPAGWIACRRCGAALSANPQPRVAAVAAPPGAARSNGTATATLTRPPAAPPKRPVVDTLLPRERREDLVPVATTRPHTRPHLPTLRRLRPSRHLAATLMAIIAVLGGGWLAYTFAFRAGDSAAAPVGDGVRARTRLLHVTTGAARVLYNEHHTYKGVTPARLVARVPRLPIASAGTVAPTAGVSFRVQDPGALVLAAPGTGKTCVFARDEPRRKRVEYVITTDRPCRALSAPSKGWKVG